jgi:SGNH hydrolase-like domain, acetyltransferase AlgX
MLCVGIAAGAEPDSVAVAPQLKDIAQKAATAETAGQLALAGKDGWLYFVPELRALSVGKFWGIHAAGVSRASKPEYADPLAAIVDFHDQLKQAGIELLLVPIPAKVAVYPESLLSGLPKPDDNKPPRRLDVYHQEFYALLREHGIELVDLLLPFLEQRNGPDGPLYCQTDSHWSGRGAKLAADIIADRVKDRPWLKELSRGQFATDDHRVKITGDLARIINETNPVTESVPITFSGRQQGRQIVAEPPSRSSPVLLMGDSHTLVFHDPLLFASGAGLPDHLARRFGFAVDLIGVRGSGATTTRIELMRRRDNLSGKRLVIWCFSFREFTESDTGWRKVPVIRP